MVFPFRRVGWVRGVHTREVAQDGGTELRVYVPEALYVRGSRS